MGMPVHIVVHHLSHFHETYVLIIKVSSKDCTFVQSERSGSVVECLT